jgi:hypothetical protein
MDFETMRASCARAGLSVARLIARNVALVPSATTVGEDYEVRLGADGRIECACRDGGMSCWHGDRLLELIAAARAQGTHAA